MKTEREGGEVSRDSLTNTLLGLVSSDFFSQTLKVADLSPSAEKGKHSSRMVCAFLCCW